MSRLRYNGLATGAAGSPVALSLGASLTNSGTTITFNAALTYQNGTAVPTIVSPDVIPLSILDSTGAFVIEVVYLTAYTAAATTGTIVRGQEGFAGVTHASGDKVISGATRTDFLSAPDAPPNAPNAKDDEFDGTTAVTWTATPVAPTTWDVNTTARDRAYLRSNGAGTAFVGRHQPIPSYPFTITAKVNSNQRGNSTLGLGLFLTVASPTTGSSILWFGVDYVSSLVQTQRLIYSSFTTGSFVSAASAIGLQWWSGPMYLRIVATSATSLSTQASTNGVIWHTLETALNPGFTPGVMGLAVSENGTADVEGVADYFRVT